MPSLRQTFKARFERIQAGWSSSRVCHLLGEPTQAEDTKVPHGSAWGTQEAMAYKIRAGEPVRQWMFQTGEYFHYVWFAMVDEDAHHPWRVTLKARVPGRL